MKTSNWITVNAILATAIGIGFALYGPVMLAFFGVPELPATDVMLYWHVASFARMFGAALFGYGIRLWGLRSLIESGSCPDAIRRGFLFSLVFANAMGLFVAVVQQFAVWNAAAGWVTIVYFAVFTIIYVVILGAREPAEDIRS